MPSKSFIARDRKSMPGFKASKDKTDLLGAKAAGDFKLNPSQISPVIQWLRIWLPMQGIRVQSLVQGDSTGHVLRATTAEVMHPRAHVLQLEKPPQ